MTFSCERCGYLSAYKGNVLKHLSNKKICASLKSDISREECINKLTNKEIVNEELINLENGYKNHQEESADNQKSNQEITEKTTEKKIPFSQDEMSKLLILEENDVLNHNPDLDLGEEGDFYVCEFCEKKFKQKNGYYRHRKHRCKNKVDENITLSLSRDVKQMMTEFKEMKEKLNEKNIVGGRIGNHSNNRNMNSNNTNNTNNTLNNITINQFGHEDRSYITEDFINRLGNSKLYHIPAEIAKQIHINRNHPENCNVKISGRRSNIAKIYNGNKWIQDDKKKISTRIVRDSMDLYDDKYSGNRKAALNFKDKYFKHDKSIARDLATNLEFMFINNFDVIEEICRERQEQNLL